ncbi:L10-interacting MYB domain-containing protein-like [Telopea speciosissima]|uniref:L10-interacting MYB domain-containing protein-like n=1 Tax=Telopea speciosissima TaxID=54955 RepID=UPI001CC51C61|nr:L10-interacting MYB domain-containing protein-like [Telopea speciosissima]
MATEEGFKKSRDIATWPSEVSYFMMERLIEQHKSEKTRDNGLRREQWQEITNAIKDKHDMVYDWEQTRNHYRVWKARVKSLCDLQKNSGMGWNPVEIRFEAPQQVWNEFKKKEQKYWQSRKVFPIHMALAIWLGNEIATGEDAMHPADYVHNDHMVQSPSMDDNVVDTSIPYEDVHSTPIANGSRDRGSGSRTRGQPHADVTTGKEKKKKGGAEKIASPLKRIAAAIDNLVNKNITRTELAQSEADAVDKVDGIDGFLKVQAKIALMKDKDVASLFLTASDEDKSKFIQHICQVT